VKGVQKREVESARRAFNRPLPKVGTDEVTAAFNDFHAAVMQLRETALRVGVIKKSPVAVGAGTGAINQSQLQIYGKSSKRSANNRALPRQKPDVDGMLRDKTGG
jgi:hypothetical protein